MRNSRGADATVSFRASRQPPVFLHLSAERETRPSGPYTLLHPSSSSARVFDEIKKGSSEWPRAHLDFSVGSITDDARVLHIYHGPCLMGLCRSRWPPSPHSSPHNSCRHGCYHHLLLGISSAHNDHDQSWRLRIFRLRLPTTMEGEQRPVLFSIASASLSLADLFLRL